MDEAGLREMMEKNHVSAFGWALFCCGGDCDEAMEVLHSAYVSILEKGARGFSGKSSFQTWMFSVIRNTARQRRSQIFRRLKKLRSWIFEPGQADYGEEHRLQERDTRNRIMALLEGLSPRQSQVLQLVFYHDLTIEEAAAVMRISVGSARAHYARGKIRLKEKMREAGWDNE